MKRVYQELEVGRSTNRRIAVCTLVSLLWIVPCALWYVASGYLRSNGSYLLLVLTGLLYVFTVSVASVVSERTLADHVGAPFSKRVLVSFFMYYVASSIFWGQRFL